MKHPATLYFPLPINYVFALHIQATTKVITVLYSLPNINVVTTFSIQTLQLNEKNTFMYLQSPKQAAWTWQKQNEPDRDERAGKRF